jgi:hypothetical protein
MSREYICLEHNARRLDEAELATAKAEHTAVCSATVTCPELIAYAVCWRYTDRPGGREWMSAALVCTGHAEAFAAHHGLSLRTTSAQPIASNHTVGGDH